MRCPVIFTLAQSLKMPGPASRSSVHRLKEFAATMAIGLLTPMTGCSTAQASSHTSAETGQPQHHIHCTGFSAHLKDAVKSADDKPTPSLPDADDPIESVPATAVDDHATGSALIGIVVVSLPQVPDTHEVATPVDDKAESLPTANAHASANPNPTGPTIQNIDSTSLLLQALTAVVSPDDGTLDHEPVAA